MTKKTTEIYEINGECYPIIGYLKDDNEEINVPVLSIRFMSDYKWHLRSLKSRLETPELYEEFEDVQAKIKKNKTNYR